MFNVNVLLILFYVVCCVLTLIFFYVFYLYGLGGLGLFLRIIVLVSLLLKILIRCDFVDDPPRATDHEEKLNQSKSNNHKISNENQ